jgi:hypothetical protein
MAQALTSKYAIGGLAVVTALGYAYQQVVLRRQPKSSLVVDEIDDDDDVDYITEQDVVKVFDKLFLEMQNLMSSIAQQLQQMKMMGHEFPESQLRGLLKSELTRNLSVKQQVVLEQYNMDYSCLEEATWEFLEQEHEYPKARRAVERFQQLWSSVTDDDVVGWRPSGVKKQKVEILTTAVTIQCAVAYFAALTDAMKTLFAKYKTEGKDMKNQAVLQELNIEFAHMTDDVGEETLASLGATVKQFEASVKAHTDDPEVGRALAELQMQQQRDFANLG